MKVYLTMLGILVCNLVFPQYYGGSTDGHDQSAISGVLLNGSVANTVGLYKGGGGDGFSMQLANILLSGESSFMSEGGNGDGYSTLQATTSLSGHDLSQLFTGGRGDGFTSLLISQSLDGSDFSNLYMGGSADGFSLATADVLTLDGAFASLFEGGEGDGFTQQLLGDLLLSGISLNLYEGGNGDGFEVVFLSAVTLSESGIAIYNGGNSDGSTTATLSGFLFEALPIELISFEAVESKNMVLLLWSTTSETNNDYFEVERSKNGTNFIKIHEVSGAGTTTKQHDYEITDYSPKAGINYYRLRQIDFDGRTSLSEVQSVLINESSMVDVVFYPNPNTERILNIKLRGVKTKEPISLNVYDNNGRLLDTMTVSPNTPVNLPWNWPAGIYRIQLLINGRTVFKSLVITD